MLEFGDAVEWEELWPNDQKRVLRGLVTRIEGDFFWLMSSTPLGSCVSRCFVEHVGDTYRILNDEELFGVELPKAGETWRRQSENYSYAAQITKIENGRVIADKWSRGGWIPMMPEPLEAFIQRFKKEC